MLCAGVLQCPEAGFTGCLACSLTCPFFDFVHTSAPVPARPPLPPGGVGRRPGHRCRRRPGAHRPTVVAIQGEALRGNESGEIRNGREAQGGGEGGVAVVTAHVLLLG